MPRPNRPIPGQQQQQGGGKLDLGKILLSIFGGVEANPDFGKVDDHGEFGPQPLKEGAGDFYKPRSIFDKAAAAEANANFKNQRFEDDQAEQFKIREEDRGLANEAKRTPILGDRAKLLGGIANDQTVDVNRKLGIAQILQNLGQEASPENIQVYNEMNTPALQETAKQGILGKLAQTQTGRTQAETQNEIENRTKEDTVNQALAERYRSAGMATRRVGAMDKDFRNEQALSDVRPRLLGAEAARNSIFNVPVGTKTFNIDSGMEMFSNPKPTLMDQMNQLKGTPSNTSPMNQPIGNQQPIQYSPQDYDVVEINGQKYLKRKTSNASF